MKYTNKSRLEVEASDYVEVEAINEIDGDVTVDVEVEVDVDTQV